MNYQTTIDIQKDASSIYQYLTQFDNRTDYIPLLTRVVLLDPEPIKVGTRYIEESIIAGQAIKTTYQVTEVIPEKRIRVQTIESIFPIQVTLQLKENQGMTLLSMQLVVQLRGVYKIASPVVKGIIAQQAQEILSRLKQILEAEGDTPE